MIEYNRKIRRDHHAKKLSLIIFWIGISLFYTITVNVLEFSQIPTGNVRGVLMISLQWLVVACVSCGILGIISLNRIIFSFCFPILLLVSYVAVYYYLSLGVGITPTSLEIALNNGGVMWESVISWVIIVITLVSIFLSFVILRLRWCKVRENKRDILITGLLSVVFIFVPLSIGRFQAAINNRMPMALYYSFNGYFSNRSLSNEDRSTFTNTLVEHSEESPDVIVVIGESLRPDHLQINGYERPTTPLLMKEANLISFKNARSTGTHTSISLPFIFTRSDSTDSERGYNEQSFITIFNRAGYRTAWIANQDISGGYAYFAHEPDTLIHVNSIKSLYSFEPWLDKDILPHYDNWKEKYRDHRKLAVIHSIGSHWWYKSHYTEEDAHFKPEINSKEITSLSSEQLINSYDNTIIATDKFLAELIEKSRDENVIMLFVSDHGESLGEGGRWLHAATSNELHDVAVLVWFSDKYEEKFPEKIKSLKQNRKSNLSTDNFFFWVIDAADLKTEVLETDKSIFHEKKN